MQNSRELVKHCLDFTGPERLPRDIWVLPWATINLPEQTREILEKYPSDIVTAPDIYQPSSKRTGNPFDVGLYRDEWGCVFSNLLAGVIGEIKTPLLKDIAEWDSVEPPYETLPEDVRSALDCVNKFCAETDKFVFAGCRPRPWERYQFLRGTENAFMDIMEPEEGAARLLRKIHDFYLKELEFWVKTDVDAICFLDDWGTQISLLISPIVWRELFKNLYKDYCDLAHAYGKYAFMHSDGNITMIYPDIVEVGVDALNSQLFCMDFDELSACAKGKITFWGEMDRQHNMMLTQAVMPHAK